MTSIDDFTIHCVEMTIKELIMDNVEIHLKTNNKKVLDYWNKIFEELLSEEHYLNYLGEEENECGE